MAKKKQQECPAGEKWAVPYADFLSLLLALFIALWAISKSDAAKAKALSQALINVFNTPPPSRIFQPIIQRPPDPGQTRDITEGQQPQNAEGTAPVAMTESVSQMQLLMQEGGVLEQIEQGIILRLPADLLFEEGKANLSNDEMLRYVRRVAEVLRQLPTEVKIDVRGYTDDSLLTKDSIYADSYELAGARASRVMRALIQYGTNPANLSYSSHGNQNPIVPNTTPENRARNNRVEIFLFTAPKTLKNIKSILDKNGIQAELVDGSNR